MRKLVAAVLAFGSVAGLLGTAVVASAASMLGGGVPAATSAATSGIAAGMLARYRRAAASCPGLAWTVLAAIGTVESDNGQSDPGCTAPTRPAPMGRRNSAGRSSDYVT